MSTSTVFGFLCLSAILLIFAPYLYISPKTSRGSRKPFLPQKVPSIKTVIQPIQDLSYVDTLFPPVDGTPGYNFLSNYNISYQNNVYLAQYGLHYCKIDKNGGSAMQATLCFLSDTEKYFKLYTKKSNWGPGLYNGFKECATETTNGLLRNETVAVANRSDFFENQNITHYAVIRDPIKRFVSAYLDICRTRNIKNKKPDYCYGCETLDCFVTSNYWYLRKKVEGKKVIKFALDWHFYPQSWYCDFANNLDKYRLLIYGHGTDFINDFAKLLLEQKVSEVNVDVMRSVLTNKKTSHAGNESISDTITKQIMSDQAVLRILYNTYYTDFQMFEFTL